MVTLVFVSTVLGAAPVSTTVQVASPTVVQACQAIDVTVATSTPTVMVGRRPQFSVVVANNSTRPVRVLDVRSGRRTDLQDVYFELFVVKNGRVVDLPMVISDPGPISEDDYLELTAGEQMDVRPLSHKRVTEDLPQGEYSAFVLFWRVPEQAHTSRCRSSEVRFVVSE
jgi:hypothetical protein